MRAPPLFVREGTMSLIWFVVGFVLCLFMPAFIQMFVKNLCIDTYNKIVGYLGKIDPKDIDCCQ